MKTVYEWILAKDNIDVDFKLCYDENFSSILEITMYGFYDYFYPKPPLRQVPIQITRTLYEDQIPKDDQSMIRILNELYNDCLCLFNKLKYSKIS